LGQLADHRGHLGAAHELPPVSGPGRLHRQPAHGLAVRMALRAHRTAAAVPRGPLRARCRGVRGLSARRRVVAGAVRPPRLGGLPGPFAAGVESLACLSPTRGRRRPRRRARTRPTGPPCPLAPPEPPASNCPLPATEPSASTCRRPPAERPEVAEERPASICRRPAEPPELAEERRSRVSKPRPDEHSRRRFRDAPRLRTALLHHPCCANRRAKP